MRRNVTVVHCDSQAKCDAGAMVASAGGGQNKLMAKAKLYIHERRLALGLTQEDLAERSGFDRTHINKLETGRGGFSRVALEQLAEALECEVKDLFQDPSKSADVVDIWTRILESDRPQARAVLETFVKDKRA